VGASVAFAGCLVAYLTQAGVPLPIGIIVTILCGFGIGAFTGIVRAKFQVPSFITTLALLTGIRGAALKLTGGFPLTPFPQSFFFVGGGDALGVPFPVIVLLVTFAVIHVMMTRAAFGRAIYAAGGNPEAARLSGIDVSRVRTVALAITGALAALSGIMLAARIMSGTPTVAQGWELDIIAATIIGGTSLSGGAGTAWGTLVGIIFIGVIVNGMVLMDVPVYTQFIVRGMLIFGAVLMNRMQKGQV
jgi:ribose/xylose/arabinose/galactoside ABC-type transport system permease subunit